MGNDNVEKIAKNQGNAISELFFVKQQLKKVLKEHGQAILKLKESEEKFKTVANYTYNWEYWLSPESTLVYNSPSCEGLTGSPLRISLRIRNSFYPLFTQMTETVLQNTGNAAVIPLKPPTTSSSRLLRKTVCYAGLLTVASQCIIPMDSFLEEGPVTET